MAHLAATHAEARGLSQSDASSTAAAAMIDHQLQHQQYQQQHHHPVAWQQHRPSPLHETVSASSNDSAASHLLHSSNGHQHTQRLRAHSDLQANTPLPRTHSLRTPRPAKKVAASPELDAIKAAVERDALRKEAKKAAAAAVVVQSASQSDRQTTPEPRSPPPPPSSSTAAPAADALTSSPPASPGNMSSLATATKPVRADTAGDIMARAGSIDSTVSAESAGASTSKHKHSGSASSYKVQTEQSRPEDVAALIAAAGSPEAAIVKLIAEKNSAATHNAQLWRLVEKQRSMILGLNKDLEKALKEKERYRRKLKENLAQSQSAPALPVALQQAEADKARELSQSPQPVLPALDNVRDASLDGHKFHEGSELNSAGPARSDTPLGSINLPSSGLPSTPQSTAGLTGPAESGPMSNDAVSTTAAADSKPNAPKPLQLSSHTLAQLHPKSVVSPALSPPGTANSFSTKNAMRKAPPAPLQLSPLPTPAAITNNIMDPSDSEYEDDADAPRDEHTGRGRRRTREQDDREREALAQKEYESRSKSKRDKKSKSKSKSKPPTESADDTTRAVSPPEVAQESVAQPRKAVEVLPDDPVAILRSRTAADASGMLQKSITAPSLMSPGLPMSPRPGDRPMNSPMPRAPNKVLNSIPMSPRAGLPFSPRAPNKAIPMPPQTPLTVASPHLARAEQYQQQMMQQPSIADRLKPPTQPSPEREPVVEPKTPGEIYRGLVTEQYPDLLLPPNALPSVYIKVASSRMRPSRNSYIAPKHADENPVFTVGIHARSDNKQLWRVEKTLASLGALDQQVKSVCTFRDRVPDKTLFAGHAPAKIDARRAALNMYFNNMVDAITDERAARVVCRFLSTDAIPAEGGGDYFGKPAAEPRPDSPMTKVRPRREGYLTKRGKNFGGWKARYFVLDGPQLKYFEAPGGAHMGSIKLQSAQIGKQSQQSSQVGEDEDNQFRHAFLILEPKRKDSNALVRHVLCAESDEERDAWVEALLAYVDWSDGEDATAYGQGIRPDLSAVRSPRLQKSLNDLRPASRGKENSQTRTNDAMRSIGYNDTVAGDAPVMGDRPIIGTKKSAHSPSPPLNGDFGESHLPGNHPNISGPTNATIIQNAGDWGMKVPPTPGQAKKEKRGLFAGFRGRSSSDIDTREKIMSPGLPLSDSGTRATFGVPLAEAVEFTRPIGVVTDLPAVVYRCIEYLTVKRAISEEGIFRLSGSNTVIKALRERFNTEGDVNLVGDGKYYDVHAVASLLKLYLRELPSTILTRDLHLEFLQCLEMPQHDKVASLNVLVHRLPRVNYELLNALSAFLLSIVQASDVNKMNVRNVGIVFSPTLNVPAPLISSFVENQADIFGAAIDEAESPLAEREVNIPPSASRGGGPVDLRSPRKQMFTDLPTPAYNQTTFQSFSALHSDPRGGAGPQQQQHDTSDTGFMPIHPTYAGYQLAPQGEGGFSSLNGALSYAAGPPPPTVYATAANGTPTPRDVRQKRRESGMHLMSPTAVASGNGGMPQKKPSMKRLGEDEGASF